MSSSGANPVVAETSTNAVEVQAERLQTQLKHFRTWLTSVQHHVYQLNPKAVASSKRLYVGNLPNGTTNDELKTFLNKIMKETGGQIGDEQAVTSCHIAQASQVQTQGDRVYAFVDFKSVEEASNAMALDGLVYSEAPLKIRRPTSYDMSTAILLGPTQPDPTMNLDGVEIVKPAVSASQQVVGTATTVPPNKLFIGGIPCDWASDKVKELLEPFGALKAFNLVMDKSTGNSKGYAFCEYETNEAADKAIEDLNGKKYGSKTLTVKRAAESPKQQSNAAMQHAHQQYQQQQQYNPYQHHQYSYGAYAHHGMMMGQHGY